MNNFAFNVLNKLFLVNTTNISYKFYYHFTCAYFHTVIAYLRNLSQNIL